jgi:hypothetical protein
MIVKTLELEPEKGFYTGQDIRGLEIRHKSLTRGSAAMADH